MTERYVLKMSRVVPGGALRGSTRLSLATLHSRKGTWEE